MKKTRYFVLIVMVVLSIIASIIYFEKNPIMIETAQINYEVYESLQELEKVSDLIVIAKTEESIRKRKKMKEGNIKWTETTLKIEKVIKNNEEKIKKEEEIKMNELFEHKIGRIINQDNYVPIKKGERYIFFLSKHPEKGIYAPINTNNGRYKLSSEEEIKNPRHEKIKREIIKKYEKEINE